MPNCLYLRKSRADVEAEARGEGETLARHEKILLDLAKRLKLSITAIHREIVSGETIAARPVMQQLLSEVEQSLWDGVLVMEVERLARGDTIDQGIVAQTFKYSNTKIVTPMKVYDPGNDLDEEYFEFGLFMSRREYKTINRRLQQGRIQSVKEGKFIGNRSPYGYRRVKLDKQKGFSLEIIPEEAEIVKMIFDLYTRSDRLGVSLVCRRLNELKIPPAKGDAWVPASVQGMLRNPVYAGKIRWNSRPTKKRMVDGQMVKTRSRAKPKDWVLTDGLHKAIIDQATFDLAQKHLSENPSRPGPTQFETKNPLAGVVVCGLCGRKMVRRPYAKKELPDVIMCPLPACPNVSAKLDYVERRLLETLEIWLNNYKTNWQSKEKDTQNDRQKNLKKKAIKKLDNELNNLEKQMNNIHDLLEQGVYSTDTFLERSRMIAARVAEAKESKRKLEEELEWEKAKEKNQKTIIPKVEKILAMYKKTKDPAKQNSLLKEVVSKAVYTKTVNGRWHNNEDDFELILYPKLPK
jgi:site-specific DNA recombinase